MRLREIGQHVLAPFRDAQTDRATIFGVSIANDQPGFDKAIDELDDRVMTNDKLRGQRADRGLGARRQAANRQQKLMLAWLDAGRTRG